MRYDSIAFKILRHFAEHPGLHRAVTIVQLAKAIDVEPGRAVHQRLTLDVRRRDRWQINKTDDHEYWVTAAEARRMFVVVKKITSAHFKKVQMREAA